MRAVRRSGRPASADFVPGLTPELDTPKICSDGRVDVDRAGYLQLLGYEKRFHTAWVQTGKARCEHMSSAVHPISDSSRTSRHVRVVPIASLCDAKKQRAFLRSPTGVILCAAGRRSPNHARTFEYDGVRSECVRSTRPRSCHVEVLGEVISIPDDVRSAFNGALHLTMPQFAKAMRMDLKKLRGHRETQNLPV